MSFYKHWSNNSVWISWMCRCYASIVLWSLLDMAFFFLTQGSVPHQAHAACHLHKVVSRQQIHPERIWWNEHQTVESQRSWEAGSGESCPAFSAWTFALEGIFCVVWHNCRPITSGHQSCICSQFIAWSSFMSRLHFQLSFGSVPPKDCNSRGICQVCAVAKCHDGCWPRTPSLSILGMYQKP